MEYVYLIHETTRNINDNEYEDENRIAFVTLNKDSVIYYLEDRMNWVKEQGYKITCDRMDEADCPGGFSYEWNNEEYLNGDLMETWYDIFKYRLDDYDCERYFWNEGES